MNKQSFVLGSVNAETTIDSASLNSSQFHSITLWYTKDGLTGIQFDYYHAENMFRRNENAHMDNFISQASNLSDAYKDSTKDKPFSKKHLLMAMHYNLYSLMRHSKQLLTENTR